MSCERVTERVSPSCVERSTLRAALVRQVTQVARISRDQRTLLSTDTMAQTSSPSLRRPNVTPIYRRVRGRKDPLAPAGWKSDVAKVPDSQWTAPHADPDYIERLPYALLPIPSDPAHRIGGRVYYRPTGDLIRCMHNGRGTTLCYHGNRRWYCGVDGCLGGGRYCRHGRERCKCPHGCKDHVPTKQVREAIQARERRIEQQTAERPKPSRSSYRRSVIACVHGSNKSLCPIAGCGGGGLCAHGVPRSFCVDCPDGGGGLCMHRIPRSRCAQPECIGRRKRVAPMCPPCV